MTVNDKTIKAEGLGHPFENIGKASAKESKKSVGICYSDKSWNSKKNMSENSYCSSIQKT